MSHNSEVEMMMRKSVAKLIAHRRGVDDYDESDYITACNIMMVVSRLVSEKAKEIYTNEIKASDLYEAGNYIMSNDSVLKEYSKREPAHFMRVVERTLEYIGNKIK